MAESWTAEAPLRPRFLTVDYALLPGGGVAAVRGRATHVAPAPAPPSHAPPAPAPTSAPAPQPGGPALGGGGGGESRGSGATFRTVAVGARESVLAYVAAAPDSILQPAVAALKGGAQVFLDSRSGAPTCNWRVLVPLLMVSAAGALRGVHEWRGTAAKERALRAAVAEVAADPHAGPAAVSAFLAAEPVAGPCLVLALLRTSVGTDAEAAQLGRTVLVDSGILSDAELRAHCAACGLDSAESGAPLAGGGGGGRDGGRGRGGGGADVALAALLVDPAERWEGGQRRLWAAKPRVGCPLHGPKATDPGATDATVDAALRQLARVLRGGAGARLAAAAASARFQKKMRRALAAAGRLVAAEADGAFIGTLHRPTLPDLRRQVRLARGALLAVLASGRAERVAPGTHDVDADDVRTASPEGMTGTILGDLDADPHAVSHLWSDIIVPLDDVELAAAMVGVPAWAAELRMGSGKGAGKDKYAARPAQAALPAVRSAAMLALLQAHGADPRAAGVLHDAERPETVDLLVAAGADADAAAEWSTVPRGWDRGNAPALARHMQRVKRSVDSRDAYSMALKFGRPELLTHMRAAAAVAAHTRDDKTLAAAVRDADAIVRALRAHGKEVGSGGDAAAVEAALALRRAAAAAAAA